MKEIKLTQNQVALVDDEDFDYLNQWKWFAMHNNRKGRKHWYVGRNSPMVDGIRRTIRMHRLIMNVKEEMEIDHKNGNGLDNCRSNLRICLPIENTRNQRLRSDNASGFKGVCWNKEAKKFTASIGLNRKRQHIGYFCSALEAAKAYNETAKKLHGEFALLNNL